MKEKHPSAIDPKLRWVIFAGIPLAIVAILFAIAEPHHALEHAVGAKLLPWVLYFVPATIVIIGMVVYDRFPQRLVVPLGIVGWIVHVSILCWFFWFGPGALKP